MEKIICSAIWVKNYDCSNKKFQEQINPLNITHGIVIYGPRHLQCVRIIHEVLKIDITRDNSQQGFLTTKFRFVDRKEAAKIAIEAGQVDEQIAMTGLFSEDLY